MIPDPEQISRVLATLLQDLNDDLADQFFARADRAADMSAAERTVAGYTWAIDRILGVPHESVVLAGMTMSRAWFDQGPV
ncbi:hypothetical protein [Nonomuraea sp. NPDC049784]|uniref:hypothetical protein n=1 Tax=Nonomuraea sp. NPDC049784 TaxID=3154361 RepID=UPI0033F0E74D